MKILARRDFPPTQEVKHGSEGKERQDDVFKEQKRRKSHSSSEEEAKRTKKTPPEKPTLLPYSKQGSIAIKNYYGPLRTDTKTDTTEAQKEATETTADEGQKPTPKKSSKLPPIIITSTVNLIRLQKDLQSIYKAPFELRNTKNGTRVLTKDLDDYTKIRQHFEQNNLSYFTFYTKSEKPLKAVIRHLPSDTTVEVIANGLQSLGFTVKRFGQMIIHTPPNLGRKSSHESAVIPHHTLNK
jgi:hypothetical protein